jgi:phenylalanyl-tRNA synthetase beta chain
MLFGLLEGIAYNINRKNNNLKMFEFGHTYHKSDKGYAEVKHLSMAFTGMRTVEHWAKTSTHADIFYIKGIVKALLERFGILGLTYAPAKNDLFSEGIALYLGKTFIAEFGTVKRSTLKHFGIKQEVLFADFNWNNVIDNVGKKKIKVSEVPKYPEVKRDLALLLDQDVKFIDLYNFAFQTEKGLLKHVDLFDVYIGDKLPEGKTRKH